MIVPINYRIPHRLVLEYGVRYFSLFLWCVCFYLVIDKIVFFPIRILQLIFLFFSVLVFHSSRIWATYTLIAHLISLIFICILIGLDANAITPYNTVTSAPRKIEILRGQLALAVLMLIFPIAFFGVYIYTAFTSLFPFRPHPRSVHPPFPLPAFVKY